MKIRNKQRVIDALNGIKTKDDEVNGKQAEWRTISGII